MLMHFSAMFLILWSWPEIDFVICCYFEVMHTYVKVLTNLVADHSPPIYLYYIQQYVAATLVLLHSDSLPFHAHELVFLSYSNIHDILKDRSDLQLNPKIEKAIQSKSDHCCYNLLYNWWLLIGIYRKCSQNNHFPVQRTKYFGKERKGIKSNIIPMYTIWYFR